MYAALKRTGMYLQRLQKKCTIILAQRLKDNIFSKNFFANKHINDGHGDS